MGSKHKGSENDDKVQLRREFGLFEGVAVIVGLVIGKLFLFLNRPQLFTVLCLKVATEYYWELDLCERFLESL